MAGRGGFNLLTQVGNGRLDALSVGGANVLTKLGAGQLTAGLLGGANVLTHVTQARRLPTPAPCCWAVPTC